MFLSQYIFLLLTLVCGNTLAENGVHADASSCNLACKGNATECCGGHSRLNVYSARQVDAGWKSIGCYTDSVALRTLATRLFPPGDLTTDACLSACHTAGYAYAGTEYGGECYCDNAFRNGGGPAPDGNTGCNMPCNGNAQEMCGGPDRLNMYQYGDGATSTQAPSATATATATNGATSQTQSVPSSTSSSLPTTTALPAGWEYKGCWVDNANGRIMNHQQPDDSKMTLESCITACAQQGYTVAGMQYSVQCFCDDYLSRGATNTTDSECNMNCGGNANEKCGAGNRDSVYSSNPGPVTVHPIPMPQTGNLTGSFKYQGCYYDDAPTRALPWFLELKTNNTVNNCIKQCSDFGYNTGGLEFGIECYCGDMADVYAAGVGKAPDTDCATTCSGNASSICGGGRRLSLYTWDGPPLTTWSYGSGNDAGRYELLIGGVVVPLITQAARNGKVTFLEKAGTGAINTTGAYELDLASIDNFTAAWRPMDRPATDVFCAASLTLPDKVGRQINVGGWALPSTQGIRLYWPDGSPGVWGKNQWQENHQVVSLQDGRWYPGAMIMANGSILVVGGEEGSNGRPIPTLEILPRAGGTVYCDWLNRTDPWNLYPYLMVLPSGGIFAQYYNEAIILDEVTLAVKKQLPNPPGAVNNFLSGRTYPLEGTAVILPQYAPYTDPVRVLVCGGSAAFSGAALDNCVSIAPDVPNAKWELERMPSQRVLSCMTALPDGTYMILNGAKSGIAGFGLAENPNLNAVHYNPTKPLGSRFTVMANTTVARLYHSEALLLDDGRVLVSGSDPLDNRFPEEYRVEVFIPPYLMGNPVRPSLVMNDNQKDWSYGGTYTFSSNATVAKLAVMGVGGSTHGNSMGQRTIFPAFSCSGGTCTVTAPPNAHVCPPGWFQVFALNAAGVPSWAQWVRIGGDPANFGAWPNAPEYFDVPGSG
ncbi:copper radical oxidase [Periconia macrospinosa]|uniref:Copper radical oxidase n=1 Tax=Periconia macrospinosa TaxID=97972 RepID=A0A2V1DCW1_9PLEO|nr:copper radical oxidase [Periconia macrospinosa]